ncbi:hypothetical protein NOV72_02114 [Caballeronia novacaledonica]|uniref:Uncharacterized protein n=1 Tax=Caballeronia novacaledonica TaxID=1544861 RepID=A0A2U3I405_9BURK|nr:hypothetical protein [Caballeronia novacaledonica]SPB14883.1 hypothetical protein NOV72_02114 [Caballeronia novacaledonica]
MSPFFLIDVAALSRQADLPRNPVQEAVPTTMIETLVRLLTSLFH